LVTREAGDRAVEFVEVQEVLHMTTRRRTPARKILEDLAGGPLTLAMFVRAIREGEGWSLADMAAKLGVTRAHVAAIERGKSVSPRSAARYASALGYSADQFVRLALQDQVRRAGLKYRVELTDELRA
jgi:plasmid maintenance system antidote protein VapI